MYNIYIHTYIYIWCVCTYVETIEGLYIILTEKGHEFKIRKKNPWQSNFTWNRFHLWCIAWWSKDFGSNNGCFLKVSSRTYNYRDLDLKNIFKKRNGSNPEINEAEPVILQPKNCVTSPTAFKKETSMGNSRSFFPEVLYHFSSPLTYPW